MIPRILSGAIILFWMIMTGLLARKIWFPAESRLAEVSPGAVYDLFAARGETSLLDVYRDRERIGTFRVTPVGPGESESGIARLNIHGRIRLGDSADSRRPEVTLRSAFGFAPGGEMSRTKLELELSRPRLKLRIDQTAGEGDGLIEFSHEDTVLLSGPLSTLTGDGTNPYLAVLLASVGLSASDLNDARDRAESATARFSARHGILVIEDRKFNGYVLSSAAPGEPGIRVYIDNAGQLLKMETPFGYSLLSREVFRPDSLPQEQAPKTIPR